MPKFAFLSRSATSRVLERYAIGISPNYAISSAAARVERHDGKSIEAMKHHGAPWPMTAAERGCRDPARGLSGSDSGAVPGQGRT